MFALYADIRTHGRSPHPAISLCCALFPQRGMMARPSWPNVLLLFLLVVSMGLVAASWGLDAASSPMLNVNIEGMAGSVWSQKVVVAGVPTTSVSNMVMVLAACWMARCRSRGRSPQAAESSRQPPPGQTQLPVWAKVLNMALALALTLLMLYPFGNGVMVAFFQTLHLSYGAVMILGSYGWYASSIFGTSSWAAASMAYQCCVDGVTHLLPLLLEAKHALITLLSASGAAAEATASFVNALVSAAPVMLADACRVWHLLLWCMWAGMWLGLGMAALAFGMLCMGWQLQLLLQGIWEAHERRYTAATWLIHTRQLKAFVLHFRHMLIHADRAIEQALFRVAGLAQRMYGYRCVVAYARSAARVWCRLRQAAGGVCSRVHRCVLWHEQELQLAGGNSSSDARTQCRPWLAGISGGCVFGVVSCSVAFVGGAVLCAVGGSPHACAKVVPALVWVGVLALPAIAVQLYWSATLSVVVAVLQHSSSWWAATAAAVRAIAACVGEWASTEGVAAAGLLWWCGGVAARALRGVYRRVWPKQHTSSASLGGSEPSQSVATCSNTVGSGGGAQKAGGAVAGAPQGDAPREAAGTSQQVVPTIVCVFQPEWAPEMQQQAELHVPFGSELPSVSQPKESHRQQAASDMELVAVRRKEGGRQGSSHGSWQPSRVSASSNPVVGVVSRGHGSSSFRARWQAGSMTAATPRQWPAPVATTIGSSSSPAPSVLPAAESPAAAESSPGGVKHPRDEGQVSPDSPSKRFKPATPKDAATSLAERCALVAAAQAHAAQCSQVHAEEAARKASAQAVRGVRAAVAGDAIQVQSAAMRADVDWLRVGAAHCAALDGWQAAAACAKAAVSAVGAASVAAPAEVVAAREAAAAAAKASAAAARLAAAATGAAVRSVKASHTATSMAVAHLVQVAAAAQATREAKEAAVAQAAAARAAAANTSSICGATAMECSPVRVAASPVVAKAGGTSASSSKQLGGGSTANTTSSSSQAGASVSPAGVTVVTTGAGPSQAPAVTAGSSSKPGFLVPKAGAIQSSLAGAKKTKASASQVPGAAKPKPALSVAIPGPSSSSQQPAQVPQPQAQSTVAAAPVAVSTATPAAAGAASSAAAALAPAAAVVSAAAGGAAAVPVVAAAGAPGLQQLAPGELDALFPPLDDSADGILAALGPIPEQQGQWENVQGNVYSAEDDQEWQQVLIDLQAAVGQV